MSKATEVKLGEFKQQLADFSRLIDADLANYVERALSDTHEQFGEHPTEAVKAFCSLLTRGGKRIRGALTMNTYYMLGGTDAAVALQAARAIEMLHAYILMVDDIQDRSEIRRGGPAAHVMLREYHKTHHLRDDAQHFGESITMNGFLFGAHSAMNELLDIDAPNEYKFAALRNVNRHFIATVHGQSKDIFNEVVDTASIDDVDKVLLWKTAYYTFMNPMQLGAILAGAKNADLKRLEEYSLAAGRIFQITDDIIGVFGVESETGKSALDDIMEGKRTVLTVKALELAPKADAYFLEQMLGNHKLTQSEFARCQTIIEDSGALEYAREQAQSSAVDAFTALDDIDTHWPGRQAEFTSNLVHYMLQRKS